MTLDIADIHEFYQSHLGQMACRHVGQKIAQVWPDAVNDVVVGYGFAIPYLERYRIRADRVMALMPSLQGAVPWPEDNANLVALTEMDCLPLLDNSVDRILMVHALEHSENPSQLLREVWRVLIDGGSLLIVVPNRRGFWARNPSTPFGHGKPYSGHQLFELVEKTLFTPLKPKYALYSPPFYPKLILSISDSLEHIGLRWMKKWGGVTLIEARKQIASLSLEQPLAWCPSIFVPVSSVNSEAFALASIAARNDPKVNKFVMPRYKR